MMRDHKHQPGKTMEKTNKRRKALETSLHNPVKEFRRGADAGLRVERRGLTKDFK